MLLMFVFACHVAAVGFTPVCFTPVGTALELPFPMSINLGLNWLQVNSNI